MLRLSATSLAKSTFLINLVAGLLIFSLAFGLAIYRIDQAPDLFTDEIIYTRLGVRTAGEGALVWDSGEPFLVHPPLYFLTEAVYFLFAGNPNTPLYAPGNIFATVYTVRRLNVFFAGLTAVLLYFFGKRIHGPKLGLILALIFSLDPFGLRINRRAMLETLAGLLALAGMLVYLISSMPTTSRRATNLLSSFVFPITPGVIIAGVLLGLALLSKELVFTTLIAIALFGGLECIYSLLVSRRPNNMRAILLITIQSGLPAILTISFALFTYLIYSYWIYTIGEWPEYSEEKILAVKRLLGLVQLTGWNRPGVSLFDFLWQRLADYGTSYAIIGVGALAIIGLALWARHLRPARLLIAWGFILYPFYAFIALIGSGNDQFFYYLLVPAMILTGYAAFTIEELRKVKITSPAISRATAWVATWGTRLFPWILLVTAIPSGLVHWWFSYGVGVDNGYAQFAQFVQQNLSPNEPLNASGDPIKFRYFLPNHTVYAYATPEEAIKGGVHYFVLTPKDVRFRYGKIRPELAEWIQGNGRQVFTFSGDSYGDIHLYYVDHPIQSGNITQKQNNTGEHWRSFHKAQTGFVGVLIIGLLAWLLLCGALSIGVYKLQEARNMTDLEKRKPAKGSKFSPLAYIKSWFSS